MASGRRSRTQRDHRSIGEVLSLLQEEYPDITVSKIRFLESQGLLNPERTPSGYRKFYEADIERLRWILVQQKENFLPLKVIKDRLAADDDGAADAARRGDGAPGSPPAPPTGAGGPVEAEPLADVQAGPAPPAPEPPPPPPEPPPAPPPPQPGERGDPALRTPRERFRLDEGATSVTMTPEELARASGLSTRQIDELEEYGLLVARRLGDSRYFDDEALSVARLAHALAARGFGARHLRMYKIAAEREAGAYEQLLLPMLQQRRPEARREALEAVGELVELGGQLHGALLRRRLRDALRPS